MIAAEPKSCQISIKPFTANLTPAVRAFNSRLTAAGARQEFRFPENPVPSLLPKHGSAKVYEEYYLSVQGETVRGGFILKHQHFSFHGEIRPLGFFHWPVSEGMVNRKYAWVALQMLRSALEMQPLLYGLGMGRDDAGPLTGILRRLGWTIYWVPFYFRVQHPQRFFEQLCALRTTPLRRLAMDLAAKSRAGAAVKLLQWTRQRKAPARIHVESVEHFGRWADELWNRCRVRFAMIGARDQNTLNALYPPGMSRFLRFKIARGPKIIGWVVGLDTSMNSNPYFGNLRVGSIVDCLAAPEDAGAVIRAAADALDRRGVDLVVSNQSYQAWCAALKQAGFLPGPSNFPFAASRELAKLLAALGVSNKGMHMTRGDGDGPIHL